MPASKPAPVIQFTPKPATQVSVGRRLRLAAARLRGKVVVNIQVKQS